MNAAASPLLFTMVGSATWIGMLMLLLEKKCPFCAELIKQEAVKCKHCGSFLHEKDATPARPPVRGTRTEALIFVALISIPFVLGGLFTLWYQTLPASERARIEKMAQ